MGEPAGTGDPWFACGSNERPELSVWLAGRVSGSEGSAHRDAVPATDAGETTMGYWLRRTMLAAMMVAVVAAYLQRGTPGYLGIKAGGVVNVHEVLRK